MCGRFTLTVTGEELGEMLRLPPPPASLEPRFNVAPSQPCPTILGRGEDRPVWEIRRWGLTATRGIHINARSETVSELPRFRDLYRRAHQRCLVPADGYFEWRREGKIRQPYYFTLPHRRPFCFAGLAEGDGADATFLVLTTAANESTKNVHHRMPVLLNSSEFDPWLSGDTDAATTALAKRLSPTFESAAVSQRVNAVGHDDPECISEGRTQPLLFDL